MKEFIKIEEIQKLKFSYSWINRFLCDKYPQNQLNHDRDRSRPRRENLPFSSSSSESIASFKYDRNIVPTMIRTIIPNSETKEPNRDPEINETSPKSVIVREFEDKLVAEIDTCGSASTFHSLRTMAERVQTKFLG